VGRPSAAPRHTVASVSGGRHHLVIHHVARYYFQNLPPHVFPDFSPYCIFLHVFYQLPCNSGVYSLEGCPELINGCQSFRHVADLIAPLRPPMGVPWGAKAPQLERVFMFGGRAPQHREKAPYFRNSGGYSVKVASNRILFNDAPM